MNLMQLPDEYQNDPQGMVNEDWKRQKKARKQESIRLLIFVLAFETPLCSGSLLTSHSKLRNASQAVKQVKEEATKCWRGKDVWFQG